MPSTMGSTSFIEPQSLKKLTLKSLKRSFDLFAASHADRIFANLQSRNIRIACKTRAEYGAVMNLTPLPPRDLSSALPSANGGDHVHANASNQQTPGGVGSLRDTITDAGAELQLVTVPPRAMPSAAPGPGVSGDYKPSSGGTITERYQPSAAVMKRLPSKWPKPAWHPPWVNYRVYVGSSALRNYPHTPNNLDVPVLIHTSQTCASCTESRAERMDEHYKVAIHTNLFTDLYALIGTGRLETGWYTKVISGHLGWVRSLAFDPGNEWFCTGSADRTIKIWETATGKLRLTLTGHIEQIRGLAVSPRHPYLFSAGDDKQVKCWDLEYNQVIRSYHGHLSGVYCLSLHPTLDILLTGGRDSVCRVWDMRTKAQIFALSGHENTVCSIITQATDPQVVTGSHDTTIKLWDLAAGKSMSTLTFHKKSVRALAMHPFEHTFASASADNIKKFRLPKGDFLHNMLSQQRTIVNCMAINEDNVLCSAGDNGSLWFWDWKSGHNFQQAHTVVQPGSLDSEAGIYALGFDVTGSRLITCEADKTIKMWMEDDKATPETHPIHFKPPKEMRRF